MINRSIPKGKPSSLKGDTIGARTKMHDYVSADPMAEYYRRQEEGYESCEAHLGDLRTHHPGRLYPVLRISAEGVPARYARHGVAASLAGSPAAMCAGN